LHNFFPDPKTPNTTFENPCAQLCRPTFAQLLHNF
jgi:hypothetical protein